MFSAGLQVLIRRDLEESAKVLGERVRSGSEDSGVRKSDTSSGRFPYGARHRGHALHRRTWSAAHSAWRRSGYGCSSSRHCCNADRHFSSVNTGPVPAGRHSAQEAPHTGTNTDLISVHRLASLLTQDLFQLGVILLRKKLYTQACRHLDKAKKNWGGDPEELAQVRNLFRRRDKSGGKEHCASCCSVQPFQAPGLAAREDEYFLSSGKLQDRRGCAKCPLNHSGQQYGDHAGTQCAGVCLLQHGKDGHRDWGVQGGGGQAARVRVPLCRWGQQPRMFCCILT